MCVNNLPRIALDSGAAGIRTHDLLIASPAPYRYATETHDGPLEKKIQGLLVQDFFMSQMPFLSPNQRCQRVKIKRLKLDGKNMLHSYAHLKGIKPGEVQCKTLQRASPT